MTRITHKKNSRASKIFLAIGITLYISIGGSAFAGQQGAPLSFLRRSKPLPHAAVSQVVCLKTIVSAYKNVYASEVQPKLPVQTLRKFFNCFPKTWNEFQALFGYSEKTNKSAPFSNENGMNLISDILPMARTVIGDSSYERRLIGITMGARLQNFADGATDMYGEFFQVVYDEIQLHPEGMLIKLNSYDNQSLQKFWFWVLIWKNYKKLESKVCTSPRNAKMRACEIMREVIKKYSDYLEAH